VPPDPILPVPDDKLTVPDVSVTAPDLVTVPEPFAETLMVPEVPVETLALMVIAALLAFVVSEMVPLPLIVREGVIFKALPDVIEILPEVSEIVP